MKGIDSSTIMKLPSVRCLFRMKARTAITCAVTNQFSSTVPLHANVNKPTKPKYLFIGKEMRPVQKRSLLVHTPSLGFIGQSFCIQNHNAGNLLKENEDHTLFFAETFSSSGSIIEEDESQDVSQTRTMFDDDASTSLNNFKASVDSALEAFKGTSSTMAIDGKINKVCNDFRCLNGRDVKMQALGDIACNLGTKPDKIRQKAEDLAGCQCNSPRFHKIEDELRQALSPSYNELFRRMGQTKGGVKFLVDLRADLIEIIRTINETGLDKEEKEKLIPLLKTMNNHLKLLLAHWFSVGFLTLEQITWNSSCSMLQKVSDYEAVHPLRNWTDLKARVGTYRRCFVYTHLSMPGEPIVVLHVALTNHISSTISSIIKHHRKVKRHATIDGGSLETDASKAEKYSPMEEDPSLCTTAIFYTITSTQTGLQGIELGTHLIKHAVKSLKEEFPDMNTFSTLSPIPGFRNWLLAKIQSCKRGECQNFLKPQEEESLLLFLNPESTDSKRDFSDAKKELYENLHSVITNNRWVENESLANALQTPLMRLCGQYLYLEKRRNLAFDSVANFHLRNGASIWRINWLADLSPRGLTNSCGLMVNYRYFIENLEQNSTSYQESFQISAGDQVIQLATQAKSLM